MAPVGQAPTQAPQPRQCSTGMVATRWPPRRTATRATAKGQASSQAPQPTQRVRSTVHGEIEKRRPQIRKSPSLRSYRMWLVGQTRAQAPQPMQSSGGASAKAPTALVAPRLKVVIALVA